MHVITERLYKTEAGEIVADGHKDARWLFAVPGTKIELAEARQLGLAEPAPKPEPKGKGKKRRAES